jgi:hypothetical protein
VPTKLSDASIQTDAIRSKTHFVFGKFFTEYLQQLEAEA